jgi:16S rRNA (adenine1518-N6/adenine1519-N6)-dimethyltransferase
MTLTEIRHLLGARGIQLTRSLGQNFLHDRNQLERIVAAAELAPEDNVLEIGPGLGPLTDLLLARGNAVTAIEKDQRLVAVLRERFAAQPGLTLLHDDALAWLRDKPRDWRGWKLVSNLPYSVASPILVELAQTEHPPERIVATLQLEVVNRIAATADSEHYGLLTLLLQVRYEPRGQFKIPGSCFFPAPDVDSGCITLVKRTEELVPFALLEMYTRIVKLALSQRRKMMLKLLKQQWPEAALTKAFTQLGLSPQIRAEAVSLDQFVALTKMLADE